MNVEFRYHRIVCNVFTRYSLLHSAHNLLCTIKKIPPELWCDCPLFIFSQCNIFTILILFLQESLLVCLGVPVKLHGR